MLNTDETYQGRGLKAATYLVTNKIKSFNFSNGAPVPREWVKGRMVEYDLHRDLSTSLGRSFLSQSKRPSYLQEIFDHLSEGEHEGRALITMYNYRESYGWAQLRSGISIKFELKHLDPNLNIIFSNKDRRDDQPRVRMKYWAWNDRKGKIKSLASWLTYVDLDDEGKGPLDRQRTRT